MPKLKGKKQAKGKPPKRGFPWLWVTIAAFIAVFAFGFTSQRSQVITPPIPEGTRAAIIDQLYAFGYPSQEFIEEVTDTLESYGFKVALYQGDEVTVDLYRNLPEYGYKFIIFRAHSGLIGCESEPIMKTSIFTSKPYNPRKHVKEQLNEELAKARVSKGEPFYFAVGSKFITDRMKGGFDNTVIIGTGCSCLYLEDLAQAFIAKGASAYLAWDATVDLDYVDGATITLIKNLCSDRITLKEAVDFTMATKGPDPNYHGVLKYFPLQNGDKALKELIQWG